MRSYLHLLDLFEDEVGKLVIEFNYSKSENGEVSKIRMDVESMHETKEERREGNGNGRGEKGEGRGEGEGRERRRRKINLKRVRRKENDIDRLPT